MKVYILKTFLWQTESSTLQDFPLDKDSEVWYHKKYKSYDSNKILTRRTSWTFK